MDQSTPLPQAPQPEIILGWKAVTVPQHERSHRWYTVGGGFLLAGVMYGILSGAWSFSVVLVLCGAMYFLLRNHVPEPKAIGFTRDGVLFDETFTRYDELKGFWIIETPTYHELHLAPKIRRRGEIVIQTGGIPSPQIRAALGQYIEEMKEKKESLIDILIRICKL